MNIRDELLDHGRRNVREAARSVGIKYSTFANWLNGGTPAGKKVTSKVAAYLKIQEASVPRKLNTVPKPEKDLTIAEAMPPYGAKPAPAEPSATARILAISYTEEELKKKISELMNQPSTPTILAGARAHFDALALKVVEKLERTQ